MSSTRTYTTLEPLSGSGGVRIDDYEAFMAHINDLSSKSIDPLTYSSKTKDEADYPRTYTEYEYLQGFTAYYDRDELIDETSILKLENFGFDYDREFFVEFWSRVSTYCQPFGFFHSPANHFPTLADVAMNYGPDHIYRVECAEGEVEVEEMAVTFNCEMVATE
jgi:hypothetical protein